MSQDHGEPYDRVEPKRSFAEVPVAIDWHDYLVNRRIPGMAVALNYTFRPSRAQATGLQYKCTTAGVLSSKPFGKIVWPITVAGTVTDGSAVWTAEAMSTTSLRSTISSDDWPNVDGLTLGTESNADLRYQVLVSSGTNGQDYEVAHQIVLTNGEDAEGVIVLPSKGLMINVSVKLDIERLKRDFKNSRQEVNRAAGAALQRVAITARKVADQTIRQRVTLKSSDVKGAITVVFPFGRGTLIRDIQAVGDPIPLKAYAARRTRKGVTFAVVKGRRKVYMRRGQKAFIVDSLGGHVFVRTGVKGDSRIQKVFGPSLTQRFGTSAVLKAIQSTVNERWSLEFDRQVAYRRQAGKL